MANTLPLPALLDIAIVSQTNQLPLPALLDIAYLLANQLPLPALIDITIVSHSEPATPSCTTRHCDRISWRTSYPFLHY